MSMNELLANYYGTNGGGQREALEKQAQSELFAKLAQENGIDLSTMTDEQVQTLWDNTFKTAEFPPPKEEGKKDDDKDDDKKKKEKAESELFQKKEASVKLAEADFLGRVMAHAYVDELNKIASSSATPGTPAAPAAPAAAEVKTAAAVPAAPAATAPKTVSTVKTASAIDDLAFAQAIKLAQAGGFDGAEAEQRVRAVLTLGMNESTKIASAANVEAAVEIRALEMLEVAGYPVTWAA